MGCCSSAPWEEVHEQEGQLIDGVPCSGSAPAVAVLAGGGLLVGVRGPAAGTGQVLHYPYPMGQSKEEVLLDNIPTSDTPTLAVRASGQLIVGVRGGDGVCKLLNYAPPLGSLSLGDVGCPPPEVTTLVDNVPCTAGVPTVAVRASGGVLVGVRGLDGKAQVLSFAEPAGSSAALVLVDDVPTAGVPTLAVRASGQLIVGVRGQDGVCKLLNYAPPLGSPHSLSLGDAGCPPPEVTTLVDNVPCAAGSVPTVGVRASGYLVVGTRLQADGDGQVLSYALRRRPVAQS
jgi:hypothetical protein